MHCTAPQRSAMTGNLPEILNSIQYNSIQIRIQYWIDRIDANRLLSHVEGSRTRVVGWREREKHNLKTRWWKKRTALYEVAVKVLELAGTVRETHGCQVIAVIRQKCGLGALAHPWSYNDGADLKDFIAHWWTYFSCSGFQKSKLGKCNWKSKQNCTCYSAIKLRLSKIFCFTIAKMNNLHIMRLKI